MNISSNAVSFSNKNLSDKRGRKSSIPISKIVVSLALFIFAIEWNIISGVRSGWTSPPLQNEIGEISSSVTIDNNSNDWCDTVKKARSTLNPKLHVNVPCEQMKPAKSAVVVYITAGVSEDKASRIVFSAKDYIDGVMALGASLNYNLTTKNTHKLLLLRQDFISNLPDYILEKMKKIGWTVGVAPIVDIDDRYVPKFARYKTVYSKISILGLSEYECVLLLDADTLVVGNIDELMTCDLLKPDFRAAGGMDLYHGQWRHFNTGSVLWRPESDEMNRVYGLTSDPKFMKRFESDQIFSNTVYPFRENIEVNNRLVAGEKVDPTDLGSIAHLPWAYNAQTHLEYQRPDYWDKHASELKIIHYTQKKGWQCQKRFDKPPPLSPTRAALRDCKMDTDCACQEGYRWHQYLKIAEDSVKK